MNDCFWVHTGSILRHTTHLEYHFVRAADYAAREEIVIILMIFPCFCILER